MPSIRSRTPAGLDFLILGCFAFLCLSGFAGSNGGAVLADCSTCLAVRLMVRSTWAAARRMAWSVRSAACPAARSARASALRMARSTALSACR